MAEPLKLDRLQRTDVLFTPEGTPTLRMQLIWQRVMEAIENIDKRLGDLEP